MICIFWDCFSSPRFSFTGLWNLTSSNVGMIFSRISPTVFMSALMLRMLHISPTNDRAEQSHTQTVGLGCRHGNQEGRTIFQIRKFLTHKCSINNQWLTDASSIFFLTWNYRYILLLIEKKQKQNKKTAGPTSNALKRKQYIVRKKDRR